MIFEDKSKSIPITKEKVWAAFKLVKSNGGAAGVDGISISDIAAQVKKHLYPVWNRLASGSYFPSPVRRVNIPKGNGKERSLGIPTVKDRVAQMVIAQELEELLEPVFSENSYGYRPNKNAHQAIGVARENCWKYGWVVDMDIKGFFDNIDHGLMIRALRHYTDKEYIITYVKRWLKAPIQLEDGSLIQNEEKGTPQGGVISPILANLYLHVVFDKWMEHHFPDCPYERYADDIIVHVKNEGRAKHVLESIRERMEQCKLELHPEKTKLVYCNRQGRRKRTKAPNSQFDFLGYTFRSQKVQTKSGDVILGFSPRISRKSMKRISEECYKLGFHRWTHLNIHQLARILSPKIRGWLYYYGRYHKTAMAGIFEIINARLAKWAFNKYKRFKRRKFISYARKWLRQIAKDFTYLFPHWQHKFTP